MSQPKSIDVHFIPADKLDIALKLLLDNGVIFSSAKGLSPSELHKQKPLYPYPGCFLEVHY